VDSKQFSARRVNEIWKVRGIPWQRNYYEHIIRNEEALQHIRQYIQNNAIAWQHDQLHPDNPSKWNGKTIDVRTCDSV
jgi:hypothetical protein